MNSNYLGMKKFKIRREFTDQISYISQAALRIFILFRKPLCINLPADFPQKPFIMTILTSHKMSIILAFFVIIAVYVNRRFPVA
jgi:hypothetical protein